MAMILAPWSSPHAGWHAKSVVSKEPFTPTRGNLHFAQLLNAPAEHNGFLAAFFSPNVAVDSMGRVLHVPSEHFNAITQLAQQTIQLPDTGNFRNMWRVEHERTDQSIKILLVKPGGNDFKLTETSVYGYQKGRELLEEETAGRTKLPDVLMELFGLLEEARDGYERGRADSSVIDAIKALL